MKTFFRMFDSF